MKNKMGGACSKYEIEERCLYGCGETLKEKVRDHLEELRIDVRIILK